MREEEVQRVLIKRRNTHQMIDKPIHDYTADDVREIVELLRDDLHPSVET